MGNVGVNIHPTNAETLNGVGVNELTNSYSGVKDPTSTGHSTLLDYIVNGLSSNSAVFSCAGFPDLPQSDWEFMCEVSKSSGSGWIVKLYKCATTNVIYTRTITLGGLWLSNWVRINDGGNADTLEGKHPVDFSQIINLGNTPTDTKTAIGIQFKSTTYWCAFWTDYPAVLPDGQGMIIAVNYKGTGEVGTNNIWCSQIFIPPHPNCNIYQRAIWGTNVGEWTNVSESNENLLINPNFKINQYGTTGEYFGTTDKHIVCDEWFSARMDLKFVDDGLQFKWNGTDSTYGYIQQVLDISNPAAIFGNNLTITASIDGTIYSKTVTVSDAIDDWRFTTTFDNLQFGACRVNSYVAVSIINRQSTYRTINWVKAEQGHRFTGYQDPIIGNELPKCQRFFNRVANIHPSNNAYISIGIGATTSSIRFPIVLPAPMRTVPTLTLIGSPIKIQHPDGTMEDGSNARLYAIITPRNTAMLAIDGTNIKVGESYGIWLQPGSELQFQSSLM